MTDKYGFDIRQKSHGYKIYVSFCSSTFFNMILTKLQYSLLRLVRQHATHHTILPSDMFDGITVQKDKIVHTKLPVPKYGGTFIVTMLIGSDQGLKLMEYIKAIYAAACVPVAFEEMRVSNDKSKAIDEEEDFAQQAVNSIRRNRAALKSFIPAFRISHSANVTLRTQLDLFINLVKVKSFENIRSKYSNLDLVIIRQNTEGEYAMLEHSARPGIVESLKIITRENTARCAKWAFEYAKANDRKKITIVHKANIMKLGDGLFLKTVRDIGKDYPEIKLNDIIVDNCTMQIVTNPEQFDVLICPNLYGNILASISCGLAGGSGVMSGENYGNNCAIFEPAARHVPYSEENENPLAMTSAAIALLYYLGLHEKANVIREAMVETTSVNQIQTADIGGCYTSDDVVQSIICNIYDKLKVCFESKKET